MQTEFLTQRSTKYSACHTELKKKILRRKYRRRIFYVFNTPDLVGVGEGTAMGVGGGGVGEGVGTGVGEGVDAGVLRMP